MISPAFVVFLLMLVFAWMGFVSGLLLALGIWMWKRHG